MHGVVWQSRPMGDLELPWDFPGCFYCLLLLHTMLQRNIPTERKNEDVMQKELGYGNDVMAEDDTNN